ncbi:hypothetical protein [Myxococcus xanthus]|uniref:hypothetical protein n=1 Tax=Myxococcus xanthus TaxID=34 RepID=UPI001CEC6AB7|nr:hypothetical protein [Myxococcus xanthus]
MSCRRCARRATADLCEALRRSKGNVAAACMASHNRTDFYELLRRHGLPPPT